MDDAHLADPGLDDAAARAAALVDGASRVTVLTGAGISTDSGIRDFRGPDGVWTRDPGAEKRATLSFYVGDPEVRRASWEYRLGSGLWDAEPNLGHRALVALEDPDRLHTLVTQNVDGLHHKAGSDPERIVEVHGNVRDVVCLSCDYQAPMEDALERVRAGDPDPACPVCGGILKSATISFGQSLVPDDLRRADLAARDCDLLLAVGTSLTVSPVCDMVPMAAAYGAAIVIVNAQPTPFDGLADVVLRAPIADVLPTVVAYDGA
jgi:NAD-dependent deacetylase